jgi:LmbE family N-acetylglucosaminyl deacetylase
MMQNGPSSARRLLGVFAHPDDEVFCAGGTMARAAEAGAEVMIVSATRGERGQIRDPSAATRRTLGTIRERELRAAAAELGVQRVQVLAYPDGTLQHHRSSLGAAVAGITRRFDPDTVITFGADGGYGHPDHVAISDLTTAAGGSPNTAASSRATAPRPRRPAGRPSPRSLRRHRDPGTHPPHTVAASVHGR